MTDITIISNCREKTIIKNWAISTEYLPINMTIGVGQSEGDHLRDHGGGGLYWRGSMSQESVAEGALLKVDYVRHNY